MDVLAVHPAVLARDLFNREIRFPDFWLAPLDALIGKYGLFEVPEDRVDEVRPAVVELMERAIELTVPIDVDWGVGNSWYGAKG